jgi:hypothetical protein
MIGTEIWKLKILTWFLFGMLALKKLKTYFYQIVTYSNEKLDIRSSSTITILSPFGNDQAIDAEKEFDGEDTDFFDYDSYEQLSDYIVEPNSKAFLLFPAFYIKLQN